MREEGIWPGGLRYLWTDAFGVVLLLSLHAALGESHWLDEARRVVAEVDRVLGRPRGLRIGEAPDRDGQYFHYLTRWMFALWRLGQVDPTYAPRAVDLVKEVHPAFVTPGRGIWWKMKEDLSGPYPGYGFGALDAFDAYVVYRLIDRESAGVGSLEREIADVRQIVERSYRDLVVTQDLGLGMMLWTCHWFPDEPWARLHRRRSLEVLDQMWVDPPGYFCRHPGMTEVKFAFTNYGVSLGLQAVGARPGRVEKLNTFFETYSSGDEYDREAITHVMGCASRFPGRLLGTSGER
jgi:hypothetical protein